ncbi:unnamed protein product [Rhodiola kirilowii]
MPKPDPEQLCSFSLTTVRLRLRITEDGESQLQFVVSDSVLWSVGGDFKDLEVF